MSARRLLASAGVLLAVLATAGAPVHAAVADAPFTATETISRTHLVNGRDSVVETRTFGLTVQNTNQLRDREIVGVSWTGAHPTGNIVGDRNSALAAQEEYPVVLMQCRGTPDTVSPSTCWTQTPAERYASSYTLTFPSFRMDRYAVTADRHQVVGQPSPLPAACASTNSGTQHWVPFDAADGTVYAGGLNGCAGLAPEASNAGASLMPSNTTYGVTGLDGTGSWRFVVNTAESNASLGCSQTVACSLVVVPVMGISCDAAGRLAAPEDRPAAADVPGVFAECSKTGAAGPGSLSSGLPDAEDLAVSGELWWSASNWQNRIAVPLTFAAPANVCALGGHGTPSFVYGSQPLAQATSQWGPHFCLDPNLFTVNHVQTSDVQAKNLLESGSVQAAFAGEPPALPFSKPVVQAPVALSGFSISYVIDDADGNEYHNLKLTPRLLAKLLTASYPSNPTVKSAYKALSSNPLALPFDPEFQALNPNMRLSGVTTEPAATLFAMSSDSDVMTALTSYINADPDARAFLDGKPDPWGMVVNPNYKGISLPTASWPQLDTFEPAGLYRPDVNPCLAQSPVPWLPLVAAPVSSMATLTLNLQFGIASSQVVCVNPGQLNQKLSAVGREIPGQRFLIGVNALADAERYEMDSAKLLTYTQPGAPSQFTSDAGRTFVAPSDDSLRAAASLLAPSDSQGTWSFPYADQHTQLGDAGAYPGTMLFTLDVPTTGLKPDQAKRFADYLTFVTGPGQTPGLGNGQLPPGYLPLTPANHLGDQGQYSSTAAAAVLAQDGFVPSVSSPGAGPAPGPTPSASATGAPVPSPRPVPAPTTASRPPLNPHVTGRSLPEQPRTQTSVPRPVTLPSTALVRGLTPAVGAPAAVSALPWLAGLAGTALIGAAVSSRLSRGVGA